MSIERKEVRPGLAFSPAALAIHNARYLLAKSVVKGRRVLDIACGEGLGAAQMASSWGAREVLGVDNSAAAIALANANFSGIENVVFKRSDAYLFLEGCAEQFDVVVCIETLEHVSDPVRLLCLIKEALKPAGTVVVTVPNDRYYFGAGPTLNEHHRSTFSFKDFKELVEAHFGESQWFAGTKLHGFAALPVDACGAENVYADRPESTGIELSPLAVATGVSSDCRLDVEGGTVFYGAVSGKVGGAVNGTAGIIAAMSHFEQGVPGVWHRLPPHKRGGTVVIFIDQEVDFSDEEARLNEFLAGRLGVKVLSHSTDPLNGLRPGHVTHIHFNSLTAMRSVLDRLRTDRAESHFLRILLYRNQTWSASLGDFRSSLVEHLCDPLDLHHHDSRETSRHILRVIAKSWRAGGPRFSAMRNSLLRAMIDTGTNLAGIFESIEGALGLGLGDTIPDANTIRTLREARAEIERLTSALRTAERRETSLRAGVDSLMRELSKLQAETARLRCERDAAVTRVRSQAGETEKLQKKLDRVRKERDQARAEIARSIRDRK